MGKVSDFLELDGDSRGPAKNTREAAGWRDLFISNWKAMARSESEHPTELELDILKVLWKESPLPVRDVRARLETEAGRRLAHSSVITMLNIMHRKGFLRRRKIGNACIFSPKVEKDRVSGNMMRDLLSRVFDGSASQMVLSLIETSDIDSRELADLRKLIGRKAKEQEK